MLIRTESQVLVRSNRYLGTSRMSYLLYKFSHFEQNFYSMRGLAEFDLTQTSLDLITQTSLDLTMSMGDVDLTNIYLVGFGEV